MLSSPNLHALQLWWTIITSTWRLYRERLRSTGPYGSCVITVLNTVSLGVPPTRCSGWSRPPLRTWSSTRTGCCRGNRATSSWATVPPTARGSSWSRATPSSFLQVDPRLPTVACLSRSRPASVVGMCCCPVNKATSTYFTTIGHTLLQGWTSILWLFLTDVAIAIWFMICGYLYLEMETM